MRFSSLVALAAAAVAPQAFAVLSVTAPTGSTTCTGGAVCQVAWEDDGTAPTLAQIGAASVAVYTGNQQQQTLLQLITASVNVATTAALEFTVNPTIGPNGDFYFIRFSSLALKDPSNPIIPFLSFSHIFTLSGMSGTFNATVQAQVNGMSTGVSASTPAAAPAASTPANTTPAAAAHTTSSTAKPSTSAKANSSSKLQIGAAGAAVAVSAMLGLLL